MSTEIAGVTPETAEASSQPALQQSAAAATGEEKVPAQESGQPQPEASKTPPESVYVTKADFEAAMAKVLEQGKRIGQSGADKYTRRVEGQNKGLTARVAAAEKRLQELDPDFAEKLRLAELEAKETDSQQQKIADEFFGEFVEEAKDRGIDPDDPRIDWASDAPNSASQARRITASLRKIEKEDAGKKAKEPAKPEGKATETSPAPKRANSVTTTLPAGGGYSDADFIDRYNKGEIPWNQETMKRLKQLGIFRG